MLNLTDLIDSHPTVVAHGNFGNYLNAITPKEISQLILSDDLTYGESINPVKDWNSLGRKLIDFAHKISDVTNGILMHFHGYHAHLLTDALQAHAEWLRRVNENILHTAARLNESNADYIHAIVRIEPVHAIEENRRKVLEINQESNLCGHKALILEELEAEYEDMRARNIKTMLNYRDNAARATAQLSAFPWPPTPPFMPVSPEAA